VRWGARDSQGSAKYPEAVQQSGVKDSPVMARYLEAALLALWGALESLDPAKVRHPALSGALGSRDSARCRAANRLDA
jgi:hypothetical protein